MSEYVIQSETLTDIADAIRTKNGESGPIPVTSMSEEILAIETGIAPTGTKTITANGTHDVTNYASAEVNVPVGVFPSGAKSITENGTYDVTNYASAYVNIDPSSTIKTATGYLTATNNSYYIGFVPDIVQITLGETEPSGNIDVLRTCDFVFYGTTFKGLISTMPVGSEYNDYIEIRCILNDNASYYQNRGFSAIIDRNDDLIDRTKLKYVAIKFT